MQDQDTKIIGRINCEWSSGTGSNSSPIFEGDTHQFNTDGLKRHLLELALGRTATHSHINYTRRMACKIAHSLSYSKPYIQKSAFLGSHKYLIND